MRRLWEREPVQRGLCFALVAGAALIAYARSFAVPFQFDDLDQIVGNPAVQAPTIGTLLGWARARIVPFITLALNARIGGGATFGYHVVNFAVHLLTTYFVFRLVLALCQTPRLRGSRLGERRLTLATAAAFFFACHPIQVQSVTYIVQRVTTMAAMFYVGAVFLYVKARNHGTNRPSDDWQQTRLFAVALLFGVAALLSKENSATLPFAIILTELVFYGRPTRWTLLAIAPFVVLIAVVPLAWMLLWPRPAPAGIAVTQQVERLVRLMMYAVDSKGLSSPMEYFFTQCLVVPRYLGLVVFPSGLNIDHDIPLARAVSAPVAAGLTLLVAALAFGVLAARRWPLVGFGILWMFLTISIESSFLPIADLMMEHRMYLPMAGVALVLGTAFAWLVERAPRPAFVIGATLGIALVTLTLARNEVWRSPLALWQDAREKSPGKARVHLNLGAVLHQEGRLTEAVGSYCRALELEPENKLARSNLTLLLDQRLSGEGDEDDDEGIDIVLDVGGEQRNVFVPADPCERERQTGSATARQPH